MKVASDLTIKCLTGVTRNVQCLVEELHKEADDKEVWGADKDNEEVVEKKRKDKDKDKHYEEVQEKLMVQIRTGCANIATVVMPAMSAWGSSFGMALLGLWMVFIGTLPSYVTDDSPTGHKEASFLLILCGIGFTLLIYIPAMVSKTALELLEHVNLLRVATLGKQHSDKKRKRVHEKVRHCCP